METEIRSGAESIEIRSNERNDVYAEGYALKFNSLSEDLGGFKEIITPEALKETDFSDVRALLNHNADKVLARSSAGTLDLNVDDKGLKFRFKIPDTTYGMDLAENLRNGNINQCSFGFSLDENGDEFRYDEKENIYKRTLNKIKEVVDISLVTYPAYKDSSVAPALRSLSKIKENEVEQRELEHRKRKLKLELELL